jgi:hypothetical protein
MLCPGCQQSQPLACPITVDALKVLQFLQTSDYRTVVKLKMSPELSRQLEELMRDYYKYLLEREVKAAAWLDALKHKVDVI